MHSRRDSHHAMQFEGLIPLLVISTLMGVDAYILKVRMPSHTVKTFEINSEEQWTRFRRVLCAKHADCATMRLLDEDGAEICVQEDNLGLGTTTQVVAMQSAGASRCRDAPSAIYTVNTTIRMQRPDGSMEHVPLTVPLDTHLRAHAHSFCVKHSVPAVDCARFGHQGMQHTMKMKRTQ